MDIVICQVIATNHSVHHHGNIVQCIPLRLFTFPLQQQYHVDAVCYFLLCLSLPEYGSSDDRHTAYLTIWIKFCYAMGRRFILYLRIYLSGDGDASFTPSIIQPFPFTTLFPHICRPSLKWLSYALFVEKLLSVTSLHDVTILHSPSIEIGSHFL